MSTGDGTRPPVDLDLLIAGARPAEEAQCPRCGWIDQHGVVEDDEPSVPEWSCPMCQHRWHVVDGEPWPDVVIDVRHLARPRPPGGVARYADQIAQVEETT